MAAPPRSSPAQRSCASVAPARGGLGPPFPARPALAAFPAAAEDGTLPGNTRHDAHAGGLAPPPGTGLIECASMTHEDVTLRYPDRPPAPLDSSSSLGDKNRNRRW